VRSNDGTSTLDALELVTIGAVLLGYADDTGNDEDELVVTGQRNF
jgi:hypothetical protein